MKQKALWLAAAALGLTLGVPPSGHADTAATVAEEDCSDGYPRLGCKIWKVTVGLEMTFPPKGKVECETTDKWQCVRDLL